MARRPPLYSPSPQRIAPVVDSAVPSTGSPIDTPTLPPPGRVHRVLQVLRRHERPCWAAAIVLAAGLAGWPGWMAKPVPAASMAQIDKAMRESLTAERLPSAAAAAYAAILPAVVRVVGTPAKTAAAKARAKARPDNLEEDDDGELRSVGTGVVITDKGLILTNLHVVEGSASIKVTFADGSESDAVVVSRRRDDDLAVLQAKTIPDDLHPATMRSTQDLSPGDEVLAVGYPFGIGPSASTGVVSGLRREFRSPEGKRQLTNLIQFDAAANPGNSGGPLVTMDGHLVGIVTAIMNPNQQRTFIGIGFAVPIENAVAAAGAAPF